MPTFWIQDTEFEAPHVVDAAEGLPYRSVPHPYRVDFTCGGTPADNLKALVQRATDPVVLIDARVRELYAPGASFLDDVPVMTVEAVEQNKTIATALAAAEFLEDHKATKRGMLLVVGGGIVQDVGAFAAAMYKRGMPWTLVPTTLLSQADSCVGAKACLNHRKTKNMLALFSAPRRVVVDTGFLRTLSHADRLSGLGEAYRLSATGGRDFLAAFDRDLRRFLGGDDAVLTDILVRTLCVKRSIVEFDEFETDLRRAMNWGHSIGHAVEALVEFQIPHGMAVAIGVLIENEISVARGLLPTIERDEMLAIGRLLVSKRAQEILSAVDVGGIVDLLRRDKKTLGSTLKLAVAERIGHVRFIDFELDDGAVAHVRNAVGRVLEALRT